MIKNKEVSENGEYHEKIDHGVIRKFFSKNLPKWETTSQRRQKAKIFGKRKAIIKQDRAAMKQLEKYWKICYS